MSRGVMRAVEELFQEACDLPPEQRQAYCDTACEQIRAELPSLLAAHVVDGSLIDRPPDGLFAGLDLKNISLAEDFRPGAQIGVYRIERMLAEGGMGRVYKASRADGQYRQSVALKVVSFTPSVDRFLLERQILADLNHPNIARLLDGGITNSGNPYIVMEYVDGEPIDAYCQSRRLGIRERLRLFLDVCGAVEYAHRNRIAHRDLKPSNILVTNKGVVKLLDFGIAKLLQRDDSEPGTRTVTGLRMMTPEYASPEQFRGGNVNALSDVYSLGVLLYKLLTGRSPYDLTGRTPGEQERIVCEMPPAKPSAVVGDGAAAGFDLGAKGRLRGALPGDLDNIVLMALRKEPERRYLSVEALREDIQRYLTGDAVVATPVTLAYRTAKFVKRHQIFVIAASLLLISLAGGVVATWQQKLKTDNQAAIAQAVNDFLRNDLLAQASASTQASPSTKPDPDLKVRTALDRAASRIVGKFDRQPDVEAAIRDTIGQTYRDLGQYSEARKHLQRALDLYRRVLGPENPETLKTMSRLGATVWLQGKYPESEALLNQTLQIQRRVLGPEHPDTLASMNALANSYSAQGNHAQAEALHSQTLEIKRRVQGQEHPETLASMNNLAIDYDSQGKYAQAEALFNQSLEIKRRVLGPAHPDTLKSMNNLAYVYRMEGKYAQAEALFNETVEIKRRTLGPEHPNTLLSINNLSATYYLQGKYAQAEALFNQTLEIKRRVLDPEHPDRLVSMSNVASACYQQGKYAQAEALFNQTLEISRRVLGPENPYTLTFLSEMAGMYQRQGKYDKAEKIATQVLAGHRNTSGPENPGTMDAAADLVLAYQSQGKFAESEPLAREAVEFDRKKRREDWQRFRAESLLGASLAGQKKYAEAEPLLLAGYQGMAARKDRMAVPDWYHLNRAREWIVELYLASGQPQKAAEWR